MLFTHAERFSILFFLLIISLNLNSLALYHIWIGSSCVFFSLLLFMENVRNISTKEKYWQNHINIKIWTKTQKKRKRNGIGFVVSVVLIACLYWLKMHTVIVRWVSIQPVTWNMILAIGWMVYEACVCVYIDITLYLYFCLNIDEHFE